MVSKQKYIPIYKQFIHLIKKGFELLDNKSQQEVRMFVISQQNKNGGFVDRGGQADLYYSLFGYWLASALELGNELDMLKNFAEKQEEQSDPIDRFSLMLIKQGLLEGKIGKLNFFKQLFQKEYPVNFSYQLFLYLLIFDARHGKKKWMNFILKPILAFYQPKGDSPSSLIAAGLVARNEAGLSTDKDQKELLLYLNGDSGFVSFKHVPDADMLSTGVSLFAMHASGFDMRLIAPSCLDFVQQNYSQGAFLSGDGDQTRDLEYTFYGLLALGCLAVTNSL